MSFASYISKFICRYNSNSSKASKEIAKKVLEQKTMSADVEIKHEIVDRDVEDIVQQISAEYPELPTTCCQTGCPNCVWLEYADKLSNYYHNSGESSEDAIQEMMQNITDGNLRAYLMHEMRMRKKLEEF